MVGGFFPWGMLIGTHAFAPGVVPISVEGYPQVIYPLVTNTTRELPEEFPFKLDVNSGNAIGVSALLSDP